MRPHRPSPAGVPGSRCRADRRRASKIPSASCACAIPPRFSGPAVPGPGTSPHGYPRPFLHFSPYKKREDRGDLRSESLRPTATVPRDKPCPVTNVAEWPPAESRYPPILSGFGARTLWVMAAVNWMILRRYVEAFTGACRSRGAPVAREGFFRPSRCHVLFFGLLFRPR